MTEKTNLLNFTLPAMTEWLAGQGEKAFGPNHPETVRTMEALSEVYHKLGQVEESEKLESRALDIRTRKRWQGGGIGGTAGSPVSLVTQRGSSGSAG